MRNLPERIHDENLIVGHNTSDDAGVYKLTDEIALVQTVDYFTPVVDDPYMFGQIAAANALSDVYAMGGIPKTVLNIVGFPIKKLGGEILAEILKGAAVKVTEAGALTIGGHSIDDQEPKFGLSVTGFVHPNKVWKNIGAKPNDALVLTKPIGVGILTTGIKRNAVTDEQIEKVSYTMAMLNKTAAEILHRFHPNSVTDVTGFGLLGHGNEMAQGSHVSFSIHYSKIPILDGTSNLVENNILPGGSKANHKFLEKFVEFSEDIDVMKQYILCDAITSGGLLISMAYEEAISYIQLLRENGIPEAAIIGTVTEKKAKNIYVEK